MPTPSITARGAVGIRKEASFGSGGGIDNWQVVESASLNRSNQHVIQDRVRNTPEQVGARFMHTMVSGQIVFPVSPNNPSQWWECGIGGTGPYTPQLPLSSMAIELQEGDVASVYSSGDMIGRIEFNSQAGDILRCTVGIEGKAVDARVTPSTTSFSSGDDPYIHADAVFTLDNVINNQIMAFSVAKENNLVTDLFATGLTRRDIPATKAVVTGSISILFENTTYRNRFFNQLPSSISVTYTKGAKSFTILLNKVVFNTSDRPLSGQTSYITETLNFTAYTDDPTAENSLKVTVV